MQLLEVQNMSRTCQALLQLFFCSKVQNHQSSVLIGETGSGKTTQVRFLNLSYVAAFLLT